MRGYFRNAVGRKPLGEIHGETNDCRRKNRAQIAEPLPRGVDNIIKKKITIA